jgi:hypothetical protein
MRWIFAAAVTLVLVASAAWFLMHDNVEPDVVQAPDKRASPEPDSGPEPEPFVPEKTSTHVVFLDVKNYKTLAAIRKEFRARYGQDSVGATSLRKGRATFRLHLSDEQHVSLIKGTILGQQPEVLQDDPGLITLKIESLKKKKR